MDIYIKSVLNEIQEEFINDSKYFPIKIQATNNPNLPPPNGGLVGVVDIEQLNSSQFVDIYFPMLFVPEVQNHFLLYSVPFVLVKLFSEYEKQKRKTGSALIDDNLNMEITHLKTKIDIVKEKMKTDTVYKVQSLSVSLVKSNIISYSFDVGLSQDEIDFISSSSNVDFSNQISDNEKRRKKAKENLREIQNHLISNFVNLQLQNIPQEKSKIDSDIPSSLYKSTG